MPEQKTFKPKFPEIPVLSDYKTEGTDEFWKEFPVNLEDEVKLAFCHKALSAMVEQLGCSDRARVDRVLGVPARGSRYWVQRYIQVQHQQQQCKQCIRERKRGVGCHRRLDSGRLCVWTGRGRGGTG